LYEGKLNMSGLVKGAEVVVINLEEAGDAIDAGIKLGDEIKIRKVRDRGCDFYANGKHFYLQNHRLRLPYPNPPHKHAEFIKVWADGAEIEEKWPSQPDSHYVDATNNGTRAIDWNRHKDFRIKPQKSAKDIKLEELEANMRKLADEIRELRDE
jgi:hypothetical protein